MEKYKDLIIVGAGIAGVTAAIYARRAGLDFFLFEPATIGGQLLYMEKIDNYSGIPTGSSGSDFASGLKDNLKSLNIEVTSQRVERIEEDSGKFQVNTDSSLYESKGVIIATGASFKKLGIKGEEGYTGKGVSYCALCDGFFFKGKEVAVVGGGNTAVEEALYLAEIAKKVTLIHRRDRLRSLDYLQKELFSKNNVEVMFNSEVKEIRGENFLKEIIIENNKDKNTSSLTPQGLFIAIGVRPNSVVARDFLSLDEKEFLITDEYMNTSRKGVWAAGDCRKRPLRQLITAASEGAIASVSAYKHIRGGYISS
ncbi:MAG: thioredoxin-disulfide reductase [Candidatus Omnitrophica bacterium]|nr:thioredoxin-disulfide reductase [Candidatus Omnitrophota bacterium]MBD3268651.1 thioredoxin-disulfide reductase [Candidatus Omnitrophota bacterium]